MSGQSGRTWLALAAASALLLGLLGVEVWKAGTRITASVRASGRAEAAVPVPSVSPQSALTERFAVPVLMYHRVANLTPEESRNALMRGLTVPPDVFDAQMRYLAEHGFTVVTAEEVEQALQTHTPLPEKCVAITLDDGYHDSFEFAYPILRRYGLRGTVFVVTMVVGDDHHLSWANMRAMESGKITIGSHTVHHYDLTKLPAASLDLELVESKKTIESALGVKVTDIAYPSGKCNDLVAERTKAAGYEAAWKEGGRPVRPGENPYLLTRMRVPGGGNMSEFRHCVWSGYYAIQAETKDQKR